MLDGKHANIGATVGMIKDIHKLTTNPKMAEEITKLFMAESVDCDYQKADACVFNGSIEPNILCRVGNCPLGPLVDAEIDGNDLDFGCGPDLGCGMKSRMQLYGENTMGCPRTSGGHIHIGYTGWRKYWDIFKKNMFHGWIDWLKTWPPYLREHWKLNLTIILLILVVYYGAGYLGRLSGGG